MSRSGRSAGKRRFPDVDPEPVEAQTCLYTTTADEHFVLERRGRIVVGSACSGHGFKFAAVIGEILAKLVDGEDPGFDLDLFRTRWQAPAR